MFILMHAFSYIASAFCCPIVMVVVFLLQDNPWAYLQCAEALYGDEPEAV